MHKKLILTLLLALAMAGWVCAAPVGTTISYQGYLSDKGKPATDLYNFTFKLYDAQTSGALVGSPNTVILTAVPVTNGLLSAALDFGSSAFLGDRRWLEIWVAPNGSSSYTMLSPRAELRPGAYSLYALKADTATTVGSVPWSVLTGIPAGFADGTDDDTTYSAGAGLHLAGTTFSIADGGVTSSKLANGQVVRSLNGLTEAVTLSVGGGLTLTTNANTLTFAGSGGSSGWSLTGNAGTTPGVNFLGTTDNQPLELQANSARALRLEYASAIHPISRQGSVSVNVIGGHVLNAVNNGAIGATIAGGGYFASGQFGGNYPNEVGAAFGSIGGGANNSVDGLYGVIPGGRGNSANGFASFAAGQNAQALHDGSFVWSDGLNASSSGPHVFEIFSRGGVHLSPQTSLYCGNQVRQMLNLWGTEYGIGVQAAMHYSRSDNHFAWYQKGIHSDNYGDPGAGGVALMTLTENFLTVTGGGGVQAYLGGDCCGNDVQLGSRSPTVTAVALYNDTTGTYMDLTARDASVRTLTIYGGSDLAEPFQVSEEQIPKGSVMIIDDEHPGQLKRSTQPYDTRVAGILSGANGIAPGIAMKQQGVLDRGENVALSGRVYVQADASFGAIRPGDLLTTSSTPGHAMKVTDHARGQGAVLGKAMSSLAEGKGMVLVLVSLQ